jgi:hypothetical protein
LDTQPVEACNSFFVILERPFLATSNALINCRNGLMKLSFGNMTLEMIIFNICKQPGDNIDSQEVDVIKELVYDQFESTVSKTEFEKYADLQMIYSQEEIEDKKSTKNIRWLFDAKVRLPGESSNSFILYIPGIGKSTFAKKRHVK